MEQELKIKEIQAANEKYIKEFNNWLEQKKLSKKTIINHINNVELFIDDYLIYYELKKMDEGITYIDNFLGDWYIRKCMWSNSSNLKTTAASIKKFYECMMELNYIEKEKYELLKNTIKDGIPSWIEEMDDYNNFDDDFYDDYF